MSGRTWRPTLCVVMALGLIGAACGGDGGGNGASDENVLEIPFATPLSGPLAALGQENLHGAEIAAEEINAAGGIPAGPWKGDEIELVPSDDQGDPTQAASVAQQLAGSNAVVVLGHLFSSACLSALPIYESAGLPMVTSICSSPSITEEGFETAFRLVPNDAISGAATMELAVEATGADTIGIAYGNNDFGRGIQRSAVERADELGVEVVSEIYEDGDSDFSAMISAFESAGADAFLALGFHPDAALQRRQALQAGFDVPFFISVAAVSPEFVTLGGDAVEGVNVVDFSTDDNEQLAALAEALQTEFDETLTYYHRNGYDAMQFVVAALELAKDDTREAVMDALHDVRLDGLNYELRVDGDGEFVVDEDNLDGYYTLNIIEGGQFVAAGT